jgi:hypothetical protein
MTTSIITTAANVDSQPAALAYSRRGDQVFDDFSAAFPTANKWRLLIEQALPSDRFEQIRASLLGFIARCLGSRAPLSEAAAMQGLLEQRTQLINYTQGGMLAPTREHTLEFNQLHRSVANAFSDFALEGKIDGIDLPINVRVVYGQLDAGRARAPFSSTKLHSDVWAGVPADSVVVVLPVLGDIENLTIECAEMARDQELRAMRALSDYDEGRWAEPITPYREASMKHGHLYLADVRLLHQTIRRRAEGVRVSIDFRLRFGDLQYRAMTPGITAGGPDSVDSRVPYDEWLGIGQNRLIVFEDSLADLRTQKISSSPVNSAKYRKVAL